MVGHWKRPEIAGKEACSWGTPSTLQRREERRLLAADIGACAAMDHHIEIKAASLDILASQP